MNRKHLSLPLVLLTAISLAACQEDTTAPVTSTDSPAFGVGNDYPGAHDYLLNIIGVPKDKTADMDDNNGHRIFVQLYGGQKVCVDDADWVAYQALLGNTVAPEDNPYHCTTEEWEGALRGGRGTQTGGWDGLDKVNKILLTPNTTDTFGVLDANATDRDGAEFTMPDDVATEYSVYARALGKPGGKAAMTLCANETIDTVNDTDGDGDVDSADIETWCSINQAVLTRDKGKPVTEDVTNVLFTLTILVDNDDLKDTALTFCLSEAGLIDPPLDGDPLTDDPLQVADVPIFHGCFEDYFWNYDNNGLKLLQLRFFQKADQS